MLLIIWVLAKVQLCGSVCRVGVDPDQDLQQSVDNFLVLQGVRTYNDILHIQILQNERLVYNYTCTNTTEGRFIYNYTYANTTEQTKNIQLYVYKYYSAYD